MLSPDEQAELAHIQGVLYGAPEAPPASPDRPGLLSRFGQDVANIPSGVVNQLSGGFTGLRNMLDPAPFAQTQPWNAPNFFDVPPPQTTAERAVDIGPQLASTVGAALVPGGAVSRLGRAAGLGSTAAALLGDAAAGSFLGAAQSPQEAAGTGAEFTALGAANLLPNRGLRLLANAAIPVGGQLLRGRNPLSEESLINTGANVIVPALLGQYGRDRTASAPQSSPAPAPPTADPLRLYDRRIETGWTHPDFREQPDGPLLLGNGQIPNEMRGGVVYGDGPQSSPSRDFVMPDYSPPQQQGRQLLQLEAPRTIGESARAGDIVQFNGDWGTVEEGADGYYLNGESGRQRIYGKTPETPLHQIEGLRPQVVGERSREPEPPFQRTQRILRSSITPGEGAPLLRRSDESGEADIGNPLFQYAGGAGIGALAGPAIDDDPNKSVWEKMMEGGVIGLGAVAAGRGGARALLRRAPEPIPSTVEEAVAAKQGLGGLKLNLVKNLSDLPPEWQARVDMTKPHEAVIDPRAGEAYLFRDNLQDPARAQQVLAHEVAGHYGFDQILPKKDWAGIQQLALRDPQAKTISQDYFGTDDVTALNPKQRETVAREYVARLAENTPLNPNLWEKMSAAVRGGLRGLGADGAFSEAEVKGLIQRGHSELRARSEPLQTSGQTQAYDPKNPDIYASLPRRLDRAAADQEQGKKTLLGASARALERGLGLGKSDTLKRAEERGRGAPNLLRSQARPLIETLRGATDAENKALLAYEQSNRQGVPLLRQSVRPEIADAYTKLEDIAARAQREIGDATGDARKQALTDETEGTYRTQRYSAFQHPAEWERQKAANPNLKEDYVQQLFRDKALGPDHTIEDVRDAVGQYEAEIQRGGNDFKPGASSSSRISQQLWTHRKDLSPEHRAFLGEYATARQRIGFTIDKLTNSLAQAKKINELKAAGDRGDIDIMDMPKRRAEMEAARQAGDTAREQQLRDLVLIDKNQTGFGKLAGHWVPRQVIDSLNAHGEMWEGGWLKAFAAPTKLMKQSLTVLNPGTHARQWLQTPLLAAAARVAPWDFVTASRILKDKGGAMYEELLRNNIIGADFSSAELQQGLKMMDSLHNPNALQKAGGVAKSLLEKVQGAYGLPDKLVRTAAYVKAKARFIAEGMSAAQAEDAAITFTNRYTMNYSAVPNAAKVLRETPFVTPFLSYQSEMLRILKNLGEDAISGDPASRTWALSNLAGLIAMPLVLANMGEGELSDKDRQDWEKVKRLSPDYAASQIRVPLGRKKDGSFNYINVGNLVPAGDTAAFVRNIATGKFSDALKQNPIIGVDKSPVLNTLSEIQSGEDSVTKRKFGSTAELIGHEAMKFAPPLIPPNYEGQRLLRSFTPNAEGGLGVENARTGRTDTPSDVLLRNLGISVSQVQPKTLLRKVAADQREEENAIKRQRDEIVKTNATPEAKQEARDTALLKLQKVRSKYKALKDGVEIEISKSKVAKAKAMGWSVSE